MTRRIMGRRGRETSLRPNQVESGFTLVEAVVLISIVGIIAAVSAPRFLAMSDMRAVQAHRQALSDFRFAQRRAASSGCPVRIDFNGSGYELLQRTQCRTGAFSLPLSEPGTGRPTFEVDLPDGLALSSSVDPLVFDARGRATNSGGSVTDVTISIGTRQLEAVGESGLIRVP